MCVKGSLRASGSFIQSFTSPRQLVGCVLMVHGWFIPNLLFNLLESLVVMSTEERRLVAEDGT